MAEACRCKQRDDEDGRTWVRECPEHGEGAIKAALLPVGTEIRHVRHPELTGYIRALEWTDRDHISPIPYNIAWDNSTQAYDVLGFMFVYACVDDVESAATSTGQEG
jgi:hypothetical protein